MPGWLARAGEALRIGADRADLWPAGTLAWLAYVGWLPLLLVIAPVDADAIEAFGVSVYLSQSFPLNERDPDYLPLRCRSLTCCSVS